MTTAETDQRFIVGTVVGIVEKDGKPTARVSVDSFYVDVKAEGFPDAHLGDTVLMTFELRLVEVRNTPDPLPFG